MTVTLNNYSAFAFVFTFIEEKEDDENDKEVNAIWKVKQ